MNVMEKMGRLLLLCYGFLKGMEVYGIDASSHYSPYMKGHAFRYVKFSPYIIDDIYDNGYVICHLC